MTKVNRIAEFQGKLADLGYIAERNLSASLLLFSDMKRPLLLEGDAGVGKTEIARVISQLNDCPLIRLQCYEGLDVNSAVYEWNYQHQLLSIKMLEERQQHTPNGSIESELFSEKYLLQRPLLAAIMQEKSPVLLIDEIDRADEEFEAYLLELLSEFQVSIPEIGTIKAKSIPFVVLTSNGTRELSDALRRRCFYHYVDYPSFDKELQIVNKRVPEIGPQLARQVVAFIQDLRKVDLQKVPGVAETLDWAAALLNLGITSLDEDMEVIQDSLVCLLKTREDSMRLEPFEIERLIARAV
ncbi:MAG: MoxR-like ATPase [Paraglaciecola sp.]|jgi:MoxR-like ATPase